MKVVITGDQGALGSALADRFRQDGFDVSGWDCKQDTDIDLSSDTTLQQVVEDCRDAVLFVNNAPVRQSDYLRAVYTIWEDQSERIILNIGSHFTYNATREEFHATYFNCDQLLTYYDQKLELDHTQRELFNDREMRHLDGPGLVMARPGFMDTPEHKDLDINKIPVSEVVNVIFQVLNNLPAAVVTDFVISYSKSKL